MTIFRRNELSGSPRFRIRYRDVGAGEVGPQQTCADVVPSADGLYFSAPAPIFARAFSSAIALRISRASGADGASWRYFSYALRAASSSWRIRWAMPSPRQATARVESLERACWNSSAAAS